MNKQIVTSSDPQIEWAAQILASAGTPGPGKLFFRGDTLYSGEPGFPIARHVSTCTGDRAVLYNSTRPDIPAEHGYLVSQAIPPETPIFEVHDVTLSPCREHLDDYACRIAAVIGKARNQWGPVAAQQAAAEAERLAQQAGCFAEAFALRWHFTLPADWQTVKGTALALFRLCMAAYGNRQ